MSISIAIAPPGEQDAIIRHTTEQTNPLITTISRLNREITLLHEYRTRLVADVVTGKMDVREAAARLPEVFDKPPVDVNKIEDSEDVEIENDLPENES